jgi:hypothetical protein
MGNVLTLVLGMWLGSALTVVAAALVYVGGDRDE